MSKMLPQWQFRNGVETFLIIKRRRKGDTANGHLPSGITLQSTKPIGECLGAAIQPLGKLSQINLPATLGESRQAMFR